MLPVRLSVPAEIDLREIAEYIAERNEAAADRFLMQFADRCDLLSTSPFLGEVCPSNLDGLRMISLQASYVIFYSVEPDRINIARIVHGARDWPSILSSPRD